MGKKRNLSMHFLSFFLFGNQYRLPCSNFRHFTFHCDYVFVFENSVKIPGWDTACGERSAAHLSVLLPIVYFYLEMQFRKFYKDKLNAKAVEQWQGWDFLQTLQISLILHLAGKVHMNCWFYKNKIPFPCFLINPANLMSISVSLEAHWGACSGFKHNI